MNNNDPILNELANLVALAREGILSDDQFESLRKMLHDNGTVRNYYYSLVNLEVCLKESTGLHEASDSLHNDPRDIQLWDVLRRHEQQAPAITIAKDRSRQDAIQRVVHEKTPSRVNKFSLITAVSCAAALLFLLLFVRVTELACGREVVTLNDSINARWSDVESSMTKGARLTVNSGPLFLQGGMVELLFDKGARVVIEAPAEFQILADDRIGLLYGKAYATVPQGAIGFSIYTKNAKVIDLGTEFGIDVDSRGDTCLHVIKGQTRLIAGEKSDTVSLEVGQGTAKKVTDETQSVTDIPCRTNLFVRAIDSKTSTIWRGQKQLKLADYVGGGNGFGTGLLNYGIHPVTGESGVATTANRPAGNTYMRLPRHPFVDGVFVPNGKDKQEISSRGHVFQECPVTQGNYFMEVINTPALLDGQVMTLNGIPYNTRENPCLFLHANIGITFDLDAIRSRVPGASIVSFQSQVGISETALRDPNADFWVLVDGELRYRKEHVQQKGLLDMLRIELSDTDRFLTLVVTDGGDPGARELPSGFIRQSIDCDWGVFADPVLILE